MSESGDPDDALIEGLLDEALEGMVEGLPPEAIAEMRALLAEQLVSTSVGRRMLRGLKPDPRVAASAEVGDGAGIEETGQRGVGGHGAK